MMSIDERLDLEHEDRRHESTQVRLTGRLKFACCHECGSEDGMQKVHRDTLAEMPPPTLNWIKSRQLLWYREPGNDEYLFYPCSRCNRARTVPANFIPVVDIQAWLDTDPMQPDYAALAAGPEPVLASKDSRDSAGI